MKIPYFISVGLLLGSLVSKAQLYPQAGVDVQHYRYDIEVNDSNNTIQGKAGIRIKLDKNLQRFYLNLVQQTDSGVGMKIYSVTQNGEPVKYRHQNNRIEIFHASIGTNASPAYFEITYSGIPADGLIISRNMYGRRTFFSDNWPDRIKNWLPANDHPADKATLEFIVTAPAHYEVVSNGALESETILEKNRKRSHWRETQPMPTKIFALGIADFEINKSGNISDSIPVYSWVFPENKENGFKEYGTAAGIASYFAKQIAPFPYKKLANVQSKTIFGGMENGSAIFYNETTATGTGQFESLLAHEIAHQWFGDMATEKSFDHLWLSEGFATYLTHLYMQDKYGADTLLAGLKTDRDQIAQFARMYNAPVVDTTQSNYMNLLNANSYQKGSWVLHMLRRKTGDAAFWNILRKYYQKYAGSNANTDDFRLVAEEVSNLNLKPFFKQWLYTPGIPQLALEYQYLPGSKKLKLVIKQLQPIPFVFPLTYQVKAGSQIIKKQVEISKRKTTILITTTKKPDVVNLDPDIDLLFEEIKNGK